MSEFTRPYARAFVEAAPADYDFGAFLEAGGTMVRAFDSSPELRAFLQAPGVPREAKSKAVAELAAKAGMNAYGARFLQVLLRNHRLLEARAVFGALRDLNDERLGILRVEVTAPAPLSEAEEKAIQDVLAARTGKTVRMQIALDPKLLGGFVARTGSRVFDGSVSTAIRMFQAHVNETLGA